MVPNYWKTDSYELKVGKKIQQITHPQNSEFVYEFNHVSEQILQGEQSSDVMCPTVTLATMKIIDRLYHQWYPDQMKKIR